MNTDIADLIAGAIGVSRGTAYDLMREALAEQPAQEGCVRCNTPKKCALYGCSPLTWPAEQTAQQEPVACAAPMACSGADKCVFRTSPPNVPPARASKPLTDEQINLFINGRGEEGDDDYVEPTGDGFGLTDDDLVQLVRRVEAAHGIYAPSELKENE